MLTRPMTVDGDNRGRSLVAGTVPPALPLAEGDEGVFSPPAPPWGPSSSPSCPPPPCASSSSSASSVTPPNSFHSSPSLTPPLSAPPPPPPPPPPPLCPPPLSSASLSTAPSVSLSSSQDSVSPPLPVPPSHSSASSTQPPTVFFTPCPSPPLSSPFSPLSSSPKMSPPPPPPPPPPPRPHPAPPCVSSSSYISPSPPFLSPRSSPSVSFIPYPPSAPLPSSNIHPSPPPSTFLHSGHAHHRPPPSSSLFSSPSPSSSTCDSPPFSCASLPSLLYRHSSFVPPPAPAFLTASVSYTSSLSSPPSSSPPVHPSHLSLPLLPPTAPSLFSPAAPPCCPCTTVLPRLLSAHRLEMRRLLRGALASLGRRLDSLERRCRRKMSKRRSRAKGEEEVGAACSPGLAVFPFDSSSSWSPAHQPPVTRSSSSDSEDTPTPPVSSSLNQSLQKRTSREEEAEGGRRGKRRRKNCRGRETSVCPENREDEGEEEEEVDSGRFVGRMVVSFRGGAEQQEAPLTLHNFNNRKQRRREGGGTNQSEKAVSVVRRNGYRVSPSKYSSHNALHLLQSAQWGQSCSQSKALIPSSGQWHFSGFATPLTLSSNHRAFLLWLCSSSSWSPAPMLRLSAATLKTIMESLVGGASGRPLRPLKDRTAPPSLSSDHCYVRTSTPSPTSFARRQQKQRANHSSWRLNFPRRRPPPLPLCSANEGSAQLPVSQSAAASEFLSSSRERGKRVSQIRIRRALPRETLLTPMGLPKVKRLKKKEFSLEEIYTNKNYKSPSTNRSLETIFEEPREKDGALLLIGQQRRRRILLFPDFTQPRKRKRLQGAGPPVAMVPRKRTAARRHCHGGTDDDESDLDVMLVERLSALEDFLTRQGLDM